MKQILAICRNIQSVRERAENLKQLKAGLYAEATFYQSKQSTEHY